MRKLLLLVLSCLLIHLALGANNQDQNSNMENVLIRMVGKRESMKKGCNWLQGTNCLDGQSLIITKLGFATFPERGAHSGERKHDGVDLQNDDEFRNSFLRKRFLPPLYLFGL